MMHSSYFNTHSLGTQAACYFNQNPSLVIARNDHNMEHINTAPTLGRPDSSSRTSSSAQTHPPSARNDQTLAANYTRHILLHSQRTQQRSLYPGVNYKDLAGLLTTSSFLQSRTSETPGDLKVTEREKSHFLFAVVHDLSKTRQDSKRYSVFQQKDLESFLSPEQQRPAKDAGKLIFLRGYTSPEWLMNVGATYRIDPEFFRRHLTFGDSHAEFDLPQLTSSFDPMISLSIPCLGRANPAYQHESNISDMLRSHHQQLGADCPTGESIIRHFFWHDDATFSIIQQVSIYVTKKGSGWVGKLKST